MNSSEINYLFEALPVQSQRQAVCNKPVALSPDMAAALGAVGLERQHQRKLLRVLNTVIDAIADKLFVESITLDNQETVTQWLAQNRWETLQRKLYRALVRDGAAYILTSFTNAAPVYSLREAYDGRCGAAYVYANNNSDEVLFALNTWYQGTDRYLDLYFPDRIEKYINRDGSTWERRQDTPDEQWPIDWTDNKGAPLGLALVKFDISDSDIEDAVQIQQDINDALLDLLATSRTMGFPQRYIIGTSNPEYLLNEYGNPLIDIFGRPIRRNLTTSPGSIFVIQGKESQFGQLGQATADTSVLDKLLHLLSLVTTVPTFYFTGGDIPSGVALIQAESRLNSKVEDHQGELTPAVEALLRLSLRLSNTFGNTAYNADTRIDIRWASPQIETEDLRLDRMTKTAQAVTLLMGAGVLSVEQAVRMLHPEWDEQQVQTEVARIHADGAVVGM